MIGELNEGPLHAALKATYVANGGESEVSVEGFVADAVRGGIVYEVQTGSFSGLARKLSALVERQPVVLVHPIAEISVMIKQPRKPGGKVQRRKVPKRGKLVHIVSELIYIPRLLSHPNFSVEVVLTHEHQTRVWDPKKRRGLGGWRVEARHLDNIVDTLRIQEPADLFEFLQGELTEPFSTRDLAEALGENIDVAQKMAYCLFHSGALERCGKQGNAYLYKSVF
ncbi:MAG: hypothetical protein AAF541_14975 [Pseudomonadota bacterium]